MSYVADETYAVYSETVVTARKRHECDACERAIPKGARYCRVATIYDGSVSSYKRCGACQATHEHLRALDLETWPDEQLGCGLAYEDEWGAVPDEVARLPFLTDEEAGRLLEERET